MSNELALLDWYKSFYPLKDHDFETSAFAAIYIIHNHHTGLYKIGHTTNFKTRLRSLRTQSGIALEPVLVLYTETFCNYAGTDDPEIFSTCDESVKYIEKKLHLYFQSKRKRGEWFELSIRDLIAIRLLFWEVIEGFDIEDNLREHLQILKEVAA